MSNGRNPGRNKRDTGRDLGGFVALPFVMLDSPIYLALSHPAKALLIELARQYRGGDNGRLLLSGKYLATRGWNSPAVIQRAKRELLDAELIFETVKGARPNKASWYALTWRALDKIPGFDFGAEQAFERGAYRKKGPPPLLKNARLTTSPVVERAVIATSPVVETPAATTRDVAIRPVLTPSPTTPAVHPLEVTISGGRVEGVQVGVDVEVDLLQREGVRGKSGGAQRNAHPEKATRRQDAEKPTTCLHAGCQTLTLGREFCAKHRPLGRSHTDRYGEANGALKR